MSKVLKRLHALRRRCGHRIREPACLGPPLGTAITTTDTNCKTFNRGNTMTTKDFTLKAFTLALIAALPGMAAAFESGSTGADGALNPTVNTEIQLPESGVLNYTSVNIPTGVTVTFKKNAVNTPVVMLVGGNATIAGTIDIRGKASSPSGIAGDGAQGDDGLPGGGGPGGFDGGRGGLPNPSVCSSVAHSEKTRAGGGLGPGGGGGGRAFRYSSSYCVSSGGGGGGTLRPGRLG